MNSDKLLETFLLDTRTFTERLGALLLQIEKEPGNADLVDQAFRAAHSLKSEASYMDYEGLTRIAHDLENSFQQLRSKDRTLVPEFLDFLLGRLDALEEQVLVLESEFREIPAEKEKSASGRKLVSEKRDAGTGPASLEISRGGGGMTDFEQALLKEASRRGELFYRIICELDDDLTMKYPKAYLIINNLELIVNVLKVFPPLQTLARGDFKELEVLFTSGVSEKEIFQAVNLDQVKRVQLTPLRYGKALPEYTKSSDSGERHFEPDRDIYLSVEAEKLDKLQSFTEELRFRYIQAGMTDEKTEGILSGMDLVLKELRLVPVSEVFGGFARLVRDMGRKTGKKLDFRLTGGDIRVDRRTVQILVEPLTHLIRNAVDHGIETPGERKAGGKSEEGQIELAVSLENEDLILHLKDDGRGILREDVLGRAKEMGLYDENKTDLLYYLIQPGFSTIAEPTPLSGRGLGLDLISRTVKQAGGGRFSLETEPGSGSDFRMQVPRGYNPLRLIIFRSNGQIFALPARDITGIRELDRGDFRQDKSGYLYYQDVPVFTPRGRLVLDGADPEEKSVLVLNHLGRKACLLAEEILFETDIPEENFKIVREMAPHQYELYNGDKKCEYLYLNPSLFT